MVILDETIPVMRRNMISQKNFLLNCQKVDLNQASKMPAQHERAMHFIFWPLLLLLLCLIATRAKQSGARYTVTARVFLR